jgi:hypothetical protein
LPLNTTCPNCGQTMRVKVEQAGKRVRCRGCGVSVVVPDIEDVEDEEDYEDYGALPAKSVRKKRKSKRKTAGVLNSVAAFASAVGGDVGPALKLLCVLLPVAYLGGAAYYIHCVDTRLGMLMALIGIGVAGSLAVTLLPLSFLIGLASDPGSFFQMMFNPFFRWEVLMEHREYPPKLRAAAGMGGCGLWALLLTVGSVGLFVWAGVKNKNGLAAGPMAPGGQMQQLDPQVVELQKQHAEGMKLWEEQQEQRQETEAARNQQRADEKRAFDQRFREHQERLEESAKKSGTPIQSINTITVNGIAYTLDELMVANDRKARLKLDDGTMVDVEIIDVLPFGKLRIRKIGPATTAEETVLFGKVSFQVFPKKSSPLFSKKSVGF